MYDGTKYNQLPQSYEEEQELFARVEARKNEITEQTLTSNTFMVIKRLFLD